MAVEKFNKIVQKQSYIDIRVLAADTAEVHTIPAGATKVIVSATTNTWLNIGAAGAIPAADVTDGTGSILIQGAIPPRIFNLGAATTIGLRSAAISIVCLEFYS
mgnify:CR=1 FL=1